jgi:hypothetical protein
MKRLHAFRWKRLVIIVVVLSCAALATTSMWRPQATSRITDTSSQPSQTEQKYNKHERIRRGLGSSVRFPTASDSNDQIKASVESVAGFIHARSGMSMSDDTKKLLLQAEKDTQKGKTARISLSDLANSLSGIAAERIGTLTDDQIERAANTFRPAPSGEITTRMSGKWGFLTKEEFVTQLKAAREFEQQGGSALELSIRPLVEEEVNDRATNLSEAMPEEFGRMKEEGVTPVQAVVIAYSIAADDPLADSRTDLAQQIVQDRMNRRITRAEAKAQKLNSPTPYGATGFFHSSPVHLVFNKTALQRLLSPKEGGTGK